MTKAKLKQKIAEIFGNDNITTKSNIIKKLITDNVNEDLSLMVECRDIEEKYMNIRNMLDKSRRTTENQAHEITLLIGRQTELKDQLKSALEDAQYYRNMISSKQIYMEDSLNAFESNYESQLKIAEDEIKRLNTIVNFLKIELFNKDRYFGR